MSAPCRQCGTDAPRIDVCRDGDVVASGFLCAPCLDAAVVVADRYRVQFDAMIAAGVSNADANRHMIAIIDRQAAPS